VKRDSYNVQVFSTKSIKEFEKYIILYMYEVNAVMEKLRKLNNKVKELRLSQFLRYCS